MILLWILGILAFLILLLCLTRLRILGTMGNRLLTLDLRLGPARMRLYPPPEKKRPERRKKPKKPKKEKPKTEPAFPVPTLEDIRDALASLPPPLFRALGRIGRGLRIHPLTLSLVFGGWDDPPAAAEAYGQASALLWTGMPLLEQVFKIPDPDIRLDVDFTAPETAVEGEIGVSARIGTLLAAGLGVGIPAVLWFRRSQRRQNRAKADGKAGKKDGTADTEDPKAGKKDRTADTEDPGNRAAAGDGKAEKKAS